VTGLRLAIRIDNVGDGRLSIFVLDDMVVGQPYICIFLVCASGVGWSGQRGVIESRDYDLGWGGVGCEVEHCELGGLE